LLKNCGGLRNWGGDLCCIYRRTGATKEKRKTMKKEKFYGYCDSCECELIADSIKKNRCFTCGCNVKGGYKIERFDVCSYFNPQPTRYIVYFNGEKIATFNKFYDASKYVGEKTNPLFNGEVK
jgi:hypothetical protein